MARSVGVRVSLLATTISKGVGAIRWILAAGLYSRNFSIDSRETWLSQLGALFLPVVMNHSTEPGHKQIEPGIQPRPEIPSNPTVQQMKDWDQDNLLQWIQQKKPNLLSGENLGKFVAAGILGEGFLWSAGGRQFFMDAGLPVGISQELAILGHEVKEGGESIPWT